VCPGEIALVILAAGASERFGSPKQLALYHGEPLLVRTVRTALAAKLGPVYVLIGACKEPCESLLEGFEVTLVHCSEWHEGMSASIRAGVTAARMGDPEAILFLLCDQPNIGVELLVRLADTHKTTGMPMTAVTYGGKPGVPALFSRSCFDALMKMEGQEGARSLLRQNRHLTALVQAGEAHMDIDTPEDLNRAN
jgi:molybdenum cofactor cytidylyltransferase